MIERLKKSFPKPVLYGVGLAIASTCWEGFWMLGPPVGLDPSTQRQFLIWGLLSLFVSFILTFGAQQKQIVEYQSQLEPKATLVFDALDDKFVQRGQVVREIEGGTRPCDEYRYSLGVVNLSSKLVPHCKLVLDASKPHDTSSQRLELPLRVRGDPSSESSGEFVLSPTDKRKPSVYVEVLQELVPKLLEFMIEPGAPVPPLLVPADIRLVFANSAHGRANWFQDRHDHVLTFRLQGDMAENVFFKLSVCYDAEARRYTVRAVP